MVSDVLKMQEGNTKCVMAGGPSKINTFKAAYDLTLDKEILNILKK
jgi:hypothetical protein